jgi:hypothetical protein
MPITHLTDRAHWSSGGTHVATHARDLTRALAVAGAALALAAGAGLPRVAVPDAAAAPGGAVTVTSSTFADDRDLFPADPAAPVAPTTAVDPRLGSPTSYSLSKATGGVVLRWNPCAAIHYRVNTRYAPAGALADVKAAIARVRAATGITFVYDGSTSVIPQANYGYAYNPLGSGTPPPLVIAWAKRGTGTGTSNLLTGGAEIARGGATAMSWTTAAGVVHPLRAVTGLVVLDVAYNSKPGGFATTAGGTRGGVLLHELGHVMGLQHVRDASQEMNPYLISRASYGNGDNAGFAKVGKAAGCLN